MRDREKALKVGLVAVILALCLRLGDLEPPVYLQEWGKPLMSVLVFAQTGWAPHYPEEETAATDAPTEPEPARPVFSPEELADLRMMYGGDYRPELDALLCAELTWQLRSAAPTVLILHTHATESYTGSWEGKDPYRNLKADKNMLAIGALIKARLEQAGIQVIHDQVLHDYPSYNNSYSHARKSTKSYLEQYPSIRLVLDIHRDAVQDSSGKQVQTTVNIGEQTSAQLMAVVGSNGTGLSHADWQTNMALAVKLHVQLEKMYPGITRPISLRAQRFNQDLSSGAMLIEVGSAGNTLEQSLIAADCLADALIALSHGTE